MNYIFAFMLCAALTVMSAVGDGSDWKGLATMDLNVAIFLWVAWYFDRRRKP